MRNMGEPLAKINKYLRCTCIGLQLISYTLFASVLVALLAYSSSYNEVIYTVETDYNKWVTPLPAISICPTVSRRHVATQLKRCMKGTTVLPQNVTFYGNLVRLGKQYCAECTNEPSTGKTIITNITEAAMLMSQPCESQLLDCSWNNVKFSCCQVFQPIPTKRGVCYSINSLQTRQMDRIPFNFVTSHFHPEAVLEVNASLSITVNIHDRRAVSFPPPRPVFKLQQKAEILYKFRETILLPTAWELGIKQRRCTLDEELHIEGYRIYSYSACKLACLAAKQIRSCGCKHHHLHGPGRNCDFGGLKCLDQNFGNLTNAKPKRRDKCGCRKDCTEQEIQVVHISAQPIANRFITSVVVKLTKAPTERIVLQARTNFIETLVAVACFSRVLGPATLEDYVRGGWFLLKSYVSLASYIYRRIVRFVNIKEHNN